ncbi:MAG: hypothetical protein HN712_06995 [Gemmatimonadetes bacterium]|nr:hypothetical protein [Gemmatimonadota bacterium]MBT7860041.1 hypothetical protein [Gemmatimonadota bacterium]
MAQTRKDVGCTAAVDIDHIMRLIGDEDGKAYIAFCVGPAHGIFEGLAVN